MITINIDIIDLLVYGFIGMPITFMVKLLIYEKLTKAKLTKANAKAKASSTSATRKHSSPYRKEAA